MRTIVVAILNFFGFYPAPPESRRATLLRKLGVVPGPDGKWRKAP